MIINEEIFKDGMFTKRKIKDYYFYSYNFFDPEIFFKLKKKYGKIIHELRGLQIHQKTNDVIWSIPKFFNYNENEENKLENIQKIWRCYEKIDGSLIKIYKIKDKIEIATKNGFPEIFINKCWEIINRNKNLKEFIFNYLNTHPKHILLFELVSNINKIIVDYKKEDLILLTIRNKDGIYCNIEEFRDKISLPQKYDFTLKELMEKLKKLKNFEGFVCLCEFRDGLRFVKFKTDWYIERHKFYQISNKRLFKLIQEEKIDDFFMYLPEYQKKKAEFIIKKFNLIIKNTLEDFEKLNLFEKTKKEIALSNLKMKKLYLNVYGQNKNEVRDNLKNFLKKITYKNFLNLIFKK